MFVCLCLFFNLFAVFEILCSPRCYQGRFVAKLTFVEKARGPFLNPLRQLLDQLWSNDPCQSTRYFFQQIVQFEQLVLPIASLISASSHPGSTDGNITML